MVPRAALIGRRSTRLRARPLWVVLHRGSPEGCPAILWKELARLRTGLAVLIVAEFVLVGCWVAAMWRDAPGRFYLWTWAVLFACVSVGWSCGSTVAEYSLAQRLARARFALCPDCGYVLRGLPNEHTCPECQRTFSRSELREYWREWLRGIRPKRPTGVRRTA